VRRFFKVLNRFVVVPMFRLGFGPFFGNPFSGYVMVMATIGRKTGRRRYTPLTYAIADGSVYCLAQWGREADWYKNAVAAPRVSLQLPGGAITGHVEDVADPEERLAMTRRILKNAGVMGLAEGMNPFRASDDAIRNKTAAMAVLRITPTGIAGGASDPGGLAWVSTLAIVVVAVAAIAALVG
jgi:deazaflavin-dependent oxidoreductase (nitroreductase family)